MQTKKQIRRQINKRRLGDLVARYNNLFTDGKITHVKMAEELLKVNITTFLRWRTFKAVPNQKTLDLLETTIMKMEK